MLFFWVFLLYFCIVSSAKSRLKKDDYYDERYKKVPFFSIFVRRADDRWEVILDLKSASPCSCISK